MIADASVLVAANAANEPHHEVARNWLGAAVAQGMIAPSLVLAEVSAGIARGVGNEDLAAMVVANLRRTGLTLVPVDEQLAAEAADIARRQRIKGCDAIYVALAVRLQQPLITLDEEQIVRGGTVADVRRPQVLGDPASGDRLDTGGE